MRKIFVVIFILVLCASFAITINVASVSVVNAFEQVTIRVPIIMYHSILNTKKNQYTVSESQFDDDIKALSENGYTAIFPSELYAYVMGEGILPEKPIMITFDDGHYNNACYGTKILKKYGFKAVESIVGCFSQFSSSSGDHSNPNYSHLTWQQIFELQNSKVWEIGNHTYNMHKFSPRFGIGQKSGESDRDYRDNLEKDITRLQNCFEVNNISPPITFAYPFGKYSTIGNEVLESLGFKVFLTCCEGTNKIKVGDNAKLKSLKRFNRDGEYTTEQLIKKIEK